MYTLRIVAEDTNLAPDEYEIRIVAEDTNLAPDEYEIRNVDLYDMYKIREISRMPANADNTRNGWRRETSPDTITVAEMLASVKGRDGVALLAECVD